MYGDDDVMYGQATSDGAYDDVEMYGDDGAPTSGNYDVDGLRGAAMLVLLALAALWGMGAFLFKGSNQS